jgi:PAS domain S-box-containing protein/diguanylate cyclase (GGDEF)-like protein
LHVATAHGSKVTHDPALAGAERAAATALRELPEALVIAFDEQLRFLATAGHVIERLGEPARCETGRPLQGAIAPAVWPELEPLLRSALAGETRSREIWSAEHSHCLKVDVGPLGADAGAAVPENAGRAGIAILLDATARMHVEALSRRPSEGFEQVFDQAPSGMGLLDTDGRWLLVNRALCDMTGYTAEELTGTRFDGIAHPEDVGNDLVGRARLIAGDISVFQAENRYFDAAGETASAIVSMSLVRDGKGAPLHYVVALQDVSERKRLEEHLRGLADRDELTGLRSRRLFECDLQLQVARAHRYEEVAGLLVIGIDDFSALEARHGARASEDMLRALARALSRRVRQTDLLARLRLEEFGVLLAHVDEDAIEVVREGLSRVIAACGIDVGEEVVHPGASIGSVLVDSRTVSAEVALAQAGQAMLDARAGRRAAGV